MKDYKRPANMRRCEKKFYPEIPDDIYLEELAGTKQKEWIGDRIAVSRLSFPYTKHH